MRLIPTVLAALALAAPAVAASTADENAAVNAVQRFFDAMAANDPAALTAATLPAGVFTSIRTAPGGGTKVARLTVDEFAKNLRPGLHEAMWAPHVVVRSGMLATVTAPYEFKLDGKSMHCGIDVFELVKADGEWTIASLAWTAEPDACTELKTTK